MQTPTDEPLQVLALFMDAMHKWEETVRAEFDLVVKGQLKSAELKSRRLPELQAIQDNFCVDSKWRRSGATYSWPSHYDAATNKIVEVVAKGKKKVRVTLQQTVGAKTRTEIELVLDDGQWKVSRRWSLFKGQKPIAHEL